MARPDLFLFTSYRFGRAFQQTAIRECRDLGLELTIVLSDPVRGMTTLKRGRTRATRPIRWLFVRRRLDARFWMVEDVNTPAFWRRLPAGAHGVITGYAQIFKGPTLERFASLVNLHPSLLPFYRGPAPGYWCVQNGEQRSGYTLHEVTEEIDAGPILRQGVVEIAGAADPLRNIAESALPVFVEWLEHLADKAEFPRSSVDAAAVYRVQDGYRSFPPIDRDRRGACSSPRRGMSTERILVTDAETRGVLALTRSLDAAGFEVTAAASADARPAPTHRSRSARRRLLVPAPLQDEEGFLSAIEREVAAGG